jgi:hypothetical protein
MKIDRRTMPAGCAATIAAMPALAAKAASKAGWYPNAILIAAPRGVNDPYRQDQELRPTDRAWGEIRKTGLTAVRDTLRAVSNYAD